MTDAETIDRILDKGMVTNIGHIADQDLTL
jgi:hypothetical protein